jgi:hypothetical protein
MQLSVCELSQRHKITIYFERVHFFDILFILKLGVNYRVYLVYYYTSLKLQHISVTRNHLQGVQHIKASFTIHTIYNLK